MRKILVAGFAALALALTGACAGDDADVDADLSADTNEDESVTEYCAFSAELDSRQEIPSDEDLDHIVEVAPEEIKDDVETLAGAIKAGDQENEEAVAAGERLEEWEDENCPEDAGDSGGAGGTEEGDADAGGDDADADAGDNSGPGNDGTQDTDDDNSGSGGGSDGDGGAEAEAEVEVGEDEETTTTR